MDELVNAISFCRNFPKQPLKKIARDNLYSHVEKLLSAAVNCVFIEGVELSGKSEFVAEYCRKQPDTSIAVFLQHGDSYFYSPEYARLAIAEQINWIVYKEAPNFDAVTSADYTRLIHLLHKSAKKKKITFVVDGLIQPENADFRVNKEILQLLPLGQPDFQFLITGDDPVEMILKSLNKNHKTLTLIDLAREEATEYFNDIEGLTLKDIDDIRKFCGGSIGAMSRFKNLLESGAASVEKLLQHSGDGLDYIMEIEWRRWSSNPIAKNLLAYLAYANRKVSLENLAFLASLDSNVILSTLDECSFIAFDKLMQTVGIPSIKQKDFLRLKLKEFEQKVENELLNQLLADPHSKESMVYLPSTLMQAGKYGEIVKRLDEDHFLKLLETHKSLRALRSNSEIGLNAARKISDDAGEVRFALTNSILKGLTFSVGSKRRIEALIKLKLVDESVSLAFSAPTDEERFHLLAVVARVMFDQRLPLPEQVRTEINRLKEDYTADSLGTLAIDIACDLLVIDLDAAIELFGSVYAQSKEGEKADAKESSEENSSRAGKKHEQDQKIAENVQIRISERHHRQFSNALAKLVDRTSATQILTRASKASEISSEIFFLKEWLSRRKKDADALKVANFVLDLMVRDLSRAPRAEDLRTVAEVLPHSADLVEVDLLIKRIHALVGTEMFLGTSIETVRMQMSIERARHKLNIDASEFAILELTFKVEELEELSARVECFSWLLRSLQRFDDTEGIENRTSLISNATNSLMLSIEEILTSSADHFAAAKGAILALAKNNIELAIKLAGSLNTLDRRDSAFSLLANELFTNRAYIDNPGKVIQCVNAISNEMQKAYAILGGLYISANNAEAGNASCSTGIMRLCKEIRLANYKFIALGYCLRICKALAPDDASQIAALSEEMNSTWDSILGDWIKCDVAYTFAGEIAGLDYELGKFWLSKAMTEEKIMQTPSERYSAALKRTISLAARALAHTSLDDKILESNSLQKIASLIDALPIVQDKVAIWSELGINLNFCGKRNAAKNICNTFVEPLINDNLDNNEYLREILIEDAAPLLYLAHPASAVFHVEKIKNRNRRDNAISDICMTLLTRKGPYELYKSPDNDEYELDGEAANSIIQLLSSIKTDWIFFGLVKSLAASLASKKNVSRLRRVQVIDLLNRLIDISGQNLPDIQNIKHDGYRIVCFAQIFKARSALNVTIQPAEWKGLYESARAVHNVADRSIVTAYVVTAAKAKANLIPAGWSASIKSDVLEIPSVSDRIDRFVWLAEIIVPIDKPLALKWSRDAMALSITLDANQDAFERQRKILDLVYSIDPDAVVDYIEMADKDEARSSNKKALENRVKLKNLQKNVAEDPLDADFSEESGEDVAELCMRNLAALNANRIIPLPTADFKDLIARAAVFGIDEAYCVWSWVLENAIRKTPVGRTSKSAEEILEAGLVSGALLLRLLRGSSSILRPMSFSVDGLVRPGDREEVLRRINAWASEVNGKEILMSDPFFGPSDMDVLFGIVQAAPRSAVRVLTGKKHVKDHVADGNFSEAFEAAWRSLADISPADLSIGVIGIDGSNSHPIHDRWLVCGGSGLRLGTSANSIGLMKLSEVSDIGDTKSDAMFEEIDSLFSRRKRTWEGARLSVMSFDIN